jgi:hypothetical protein
MKLALIPFLFFLVTDRAISQPCSPTHGSASPGSLEYELNPLKNRTAHPASGDLKTSITLNAILAIGNDITRFLNTDGATIEGWVIGTKLEGVESWKAWKAATATRPPAKTGTTTSP